MTKKGGKNYRAHGGKAARWRQQRAALQPASVNIQAKVRRQDVNSSAAATTATMPSKKAARAPNRALPKQRNPLLSVEESPGHAELIRRRRLGQTKLEVKPGQVGTNNATKPENLGLFDYAHLRVPLPKELKGSEIFAHHPHQPAPEAYFLMRRSSDGAVSASGMFKAAFPWASHHEEHAEKEYVKELTSANTDEVAGNVWISEHLAIELADEYGIAAWIAALLDGAPVTQPEDLKKGPHEKAISPPPKFKFTAGDKAHLPPPNGTTPARAGTPKARGRPRAGSPVKDGSPVKASAKKPTKKQKEAAAKEASEALNAQINGVVPPAADGKEDKKKDSKDVNGETVKVNVESTVETHDGTETTTTNVQVEMPKGSADLPLPDNPEEMIATAKKMVEEAQKLDGEIGSSSTKRKAEELDDDDDEGDEELQPAKRARLAEQKLKTARVRNRALVGVATTLVIGAIIPYFTG